MFNYTSRNYFKWGWENETFAKYRLGGTFFASLDFSGIGEVKSWREECIRAAKSIADSTQKPLMLGFSGGMDSQAAYLAFKEAGVPIKVMFCHYTLGQNLHDYVVAKQFCRLHNIELVEVQLSVEDFYRDKAVALCEEVGVSSPRQLLQSTLGDFMPDHCYVMAAGDMKPSYDEEAGQMGFSIGATPVVQYQINRELEAVTRFFMYSPEMLAAHLNHPIIKLTEQCVEAIAAASEFGYTSELYTHATKPLIYADAWGDALVHTPKFTGFERVESTRTVKELGGSNVLRGLGRGLAQCKAKFKLADVRNAIETGTSISRKAPTKLQLLKSSKT